MVGYAREGAPSAGMVVVMARAGAALLSMREGAHRNLKALVGHGTGGNGSAANIAGVSAAEVAWLDDRRIGRGLPRAALA